MRAFVDALLENWLNGNRKDVIARLAALHPLHAARAAALLYADLAHEGGSNDQGIFGRLLQGAAPDFNEEF